MYSGIIASVITFDHFKSFVNHPGKYDSLSGAVVSTFTGMSFPFFVDLHFTLTPSQVDVFSEPRWQDGKYFEWTFCEQIC